MARGSGPSKRFVALGLLVLLVAGAAAVWGVSLQRRHELREVMGRVEQARREVLSAALAEKVERITAGARGDQERCLRIARWIAANINNRGNHVDILRSFADRAGLCFTRARLFCKMASYLAIDARVFNIYNFGGPGGGHSCAQAYYDGSWHFFDLTYAGVFVKNDVVLSWAEIKADPAGAIEHMVVFDQTLDRYGNIGEALATRGRVDNRRRMSEVYSLANLRAADTYGFWRQLPVKVLHPVVDCSRLQNVLVIGGRGARHTTGQGVALGLSEYLGHALVTDHDYFHTQWRFTNCTPGRPLVVRYRLGRAKGSDLRYWARAQGATITAGQRLELGWLARWWAGDWEIVLVPNKSSCTLTLGYDFRKPGTGVRVRGIEIAWGTP